MKRPQVTHLGGHSPQPCTGQSSAGSSPITEQRQVRGRSQICSMETPECGGLIAPAKTTQPQTNGEILDPIRPSQYGIQVPLEILQPLQQKPRLQTRVGNPLRPPWTCQCGYINRVFEYVCPNCWEDRLPRIAEDTSL